MLSNGIVLNGGADKKVKPGGAATDGGAPSDGGAATEGGDAPVSGKVADEVKANSPYWKRVADDARQYGSTAPP